MTENIKFISKLFEICNTIRVKINTILIYRRYELLCWMRTIKSFFGVHALVSFWCVLVKIPIWHSFKETKLFFSIDDFQQLFSEHNSANKLLHCFLHFSVEEFIPDKRINFHEPRQGWKITPSSNTIVLNFLGLRLVFCIIKSHLL